MIIVLTVFFIWGVFVTTAMEMRKLKLPKKTGPVSLSESNTGAQILYALREGLKITFSTLGGDSDELMILIEKNQQSGNQFVNSGYRFLGWTLVLVLPFLATANLVVLAGAFHKILSGHLFAMPVAFGCFGAKKVFVFSCLSRESAQMAKSLAPKDGKNTAIFLRSQIDMSEQAGEEIQAVLQNVRGVSFPGSEEQLKQFSSRLWNKTKAFYFISENAEDNFTFAGNLLMLLEEQKKKQRKISEPKEIFVFSEKASGPRLIDRLRREATKEYRKSIHLIDPSRAMVYYLLRQYPLIVPDEDHSGILVIGLGNFGKEFLKAVLSFAVVNKNKPKFYICDRDAQKQFSKFELMTQEVCARNLFILWDEEALSFGFHQKLKHISEELFGIVISLGEDELNFQMAIQLVILLRRRHWNHIARGEGNNPIRIFVHIRDQSKKLELCNWCAEQKEWKPSIYIFGTLQDAYCPEVLTPYKIWDQAEKLHNDLKKIGNDNFESHDKKEFAQEIKDTSYACEYERRSSIACISHLSYYVLNALGAEKREEFYTASNTEADYQTRKRVYHQAILAYQWQMGNQHNLAALEHHRWMNYVRSEGFCYAKDQVRHAYKSALGTHLDRDALLSPCLIPFEDLETLEKECEIQFRKKDQYVMKNAIVYTNKIWN